MQNPGSLFAGFGGNFRPVSYTHLYGGTQQEKAAYLREAQFRAQSLIPYSAMISTNDLVAVSYTHLS